MDMDMECVFESVCNKRTANCIQGGCIRQLEFTHLWDSAKLPAWKKYVGVKLRPETVDVGAFRRLSEIKRNVVEFVQGGGNLYIYSTQYGNGKTTWAVKLMASYFMEVWGGNGFKQRGAFVNVPWLLHKSTEIINHPDEDFEEFRRTIPLVDIVVWDDIGATYTTEYDYKNMLALVEQRMLAGKCNVFTGNLDYKQFGEKLGGRLQSKIFHESEAIEFRGADRRGRQ